MLQCLIILYGKKLSWLIPKKVHSYFFVMMETRIYCDKTNFFVIHQIEYQQNLAFLSIHQIKSSPIFSKFREFVKLSPRQIWYTFQFNIHELVYKYISHERICKSVFFAGTYFHKKDQQTPRESTRHFLQVIFAK